MRHSFALYRLIESQNRPREIIIKTIVHTIGNVVQIQIFDSPKDVYKPFLVNNKEAFLVSIPKINPEMSYILVYHQGISHDIKYPLSLKQEYMTLRHHFPNSCFIKTLMTCGEPITSEFWGNIWTLLTSL